MSIAQEHLKVKADELGKSFDLTDDQLYLLEIKFQTPLMVSRYKADIPVPGLPNLDGILQYASFYWCASVGVAEHPKLATDYLWQVNEALYGHGWIDFPVPLSSLIIDHPGTKDQKRLYDCSVGLPVDPSSEMTCYPIGSELLRQDGKQFKRIVDGLPLRRRVLHPQEAYKPIFLSHQLDTRRGATKALDNMIYILIVDIYRFLFRGDAAWVDRLLKHMQKDGVGIGKKTALGYGRISNVDISPIKTDFIATLGYHLNENQKLTLGLEDDTTVITILKNIPYDVLLGWCASGKNNKTLFGCSDVKLLSMIPVLGGYTPPYWLRSRQTLIAQYGSLLYGRS